MIIKHATRVFWPYPSHIALQGRYREPEMGIPD